MSTLAVILANVRRNLGETTVNFYTDAELKQYIGEAYKKYSMVMLREGDGYFETTTNLAITADNPLVSVGSLSPAFFKISQLEKNTAYGSIPLRPYQRRFKINSSISVGAGETYLPTYKMRSMNLVLEPTPKSSESASATTGLKLDYIYVPTYPDSSTATSFEFDSNFSPMFEPMIELYATIRAMEAKDAMGGVSDMATFRSNLETYESEFLQTLSRDEYPDEVEYIGFDYTDPFS